jgi:3-oxoacyl-[acyl-carrier-protein] synthase-3
LTAAIQAGADGDSTHVDMRMVVAPTTGIFRPGPVGDVSTEGEVVTIGTVLGHIEGPGMQAEVTSFCRGFLVRMLAQEGERVQTGQPLAWIHPVDGLPRNVRPDVPRRPPHFPLRFLSVGGHVPGPRITNDDLSAQLDTSDAWIASRTGIRARHHAAPGEGTTDLAVAAARLALGKSDVDPSTIGLVIVATSTPDSACPSTAARVAAGLGIDGGGFDVNGACSGFVNALQTAAALSQDPHVGPILVIGADRFSSLVDPDDRNTAVLFGDGAGAVLVDSPGHADPVAVDPGILASDLGGSSASLGVLEVAPGARYLRMDGRELFRLATRALVTSARITTERAGASTEDIDLWVPHQANERIIAAAARQLDLPDERVVLDVAERANTSAASIPLALASAEADGRLTEGTRVLLSGVGAGLSWATSYLRWGR